jgi:hypothetical protein
MKSLKVVIIISLFFYLPISAMAWGAEGHRIVGQIAESYLTKNAKKEIAKILGTEPMAIASTWMDFIKSDPAYNYLSSWHYINLKAGLSPVELQNFLDNDTATDAYTKINFLAAELKKKEISIENKRFYLRILIHLVGDIHQPMHTGRLEDLGGNKVKVLWFNDSKNLHQLWDDQLILFQQLSYTEYAASINHITSAERVTMISEPIGTWIYQSYQLSEKIYGEITQPDQKLNYKYNFDYVAPLNLQLLRGGVHLAGLLNAIFDK